MSDNASALDAASTTHHSSLNTGNCLTMIVKSSTLMRPTIVTCQRCLQASVISDFTEKDPNTALDGVISKVKILVLTNHGQSHVAPLGHSKYISATTDISNTHVTIATTAETYQH